MSKALLALQAALKKYGPTAVESMLAWLAIASDNRLDSLEAAMKFGSSSEDRFALVAQAAVEAGVDPRMFMPAAANSPNMMALAKSLTEVYRSISTSIDKEHGNKLKSSNDDTTRDIVRLQMGRVLVRAFGSYAFARQVQMALETLTADDITWLEAMADA